MSLGNDACYLAKAYTNSEASQITEQGFAEEALTERGLPILFPKRETIGKYRDLFRKP